MKVFLTSSPCISGSPELNPANGFVRQLMCCIPNPAHGLFISASPSEIELTEAIAQGMKESIAEAGANFLTYRVLHDATADMAPEWVAGANFIILSGGHVPTQNAFFKRIHLDLLLQGYKGLLMGISAGSMNCAKWVYAMPELDGESMNPFYHRFIPGLGLTNTMIIPHFQKLRYESLDGKRLIEDIAFRDSMNRRFYALPDGSYIYKNGSREQLHGPAWQVANGRLSVANHEGEVLILEE